MMPRTDSNRRPIDYKSIDVKINNKINLILYMIKIEVYRKKLKLNN